MSTLKFTVTMILVQLAVMLVIYNFYGLTSCQKDATMTTTSMTRIAIRAVSK